MLYSLFIEEEQIKISKLVLAPTSPPLVKSQLVLKLVLALPLVH